MTGMRKRVTAGFLSIVCLLFFSGMVSFLELSRLSRDTDEILGANQRSIRLAREMLDAVHGLRTGRRSIRWPSPRPGCACLRTGSWLPMRHGGPTRWPFAGPIRSVQGGTGPNTGLTTTGWFRPSTIT